MYDISNLYREMIIDHNRHPRNFGKPDTFTHKLEGFNPLCGDKLVLYIDMPANIIQGVGFDGEGCAISVASASLMTDMIKGENMDTAQRMFEKFHTLVSTDEKLEDENLGKLEALAGVRDFPSRVKCATLCWHTLNALLHDRHEPISTE